MKKSLQRIKYPRTLHLPWSQGFSRDDMVLSDLSGFIGEEVVITEKMDGENTTMYNNYLHARSIDYKPHKSRDWVQNLLKKEGWYIPDGWRVCGENLYAKKSIEYKDLDSYFLLFSIWEGNRCFSWDDTLIYSTLLGFPTVPVIFRGKFDEKFIKSLIVDPQTTEGYVVRVTREFEFKEFRKVVGKYVRKDHVQTHGGWMRRKLEKNSLK